MGKRKTEEKKEYVLGRVGTNLQIGIVGLPNVGKSTFFNGLTRSAIPAENFPFCTIDPNEARVAVPDERFDWLASHWDPSSVVPAYLKVVDIAGLVKGAANGEGLGNAFLSHIKACDAIFHMVRVFENTEITHTEGSVDPLRDIEIINQELILKDEEFLQKKHDVLIKASMGDKEKKVELETVKKALDLLSNRIEVRFGDWGNKDIYYLNQYQLITAKPVIFLVNMSPKDYKEKSNKYYDKIKEYIKKRSDGRDSILPFSAEMERKFIKLEKKKGKEAVTEFCKKNEVFSALPSIIVLGFATLGLHFYFTAGKKEVKCWTIKKGTKAPQAAGKIHSDFEDTFIAADVMKYVDYREHGSEASVKSAGLYKKQGRQYVVEDGDILLFHFGERKK